MDQTAFLSCYYFIKKKQARYTGVAWYIFLCANTYKYAYIARSNNGNDGKLRNNKKLKK